MNRGRRSFWRVIALAMSLAALPLLQLHAAPPSGGIVRIADRPDETFQSIQAAIDTAPRDAVIQIGAGRYDERLKITKPIKLVGAGTDKTVIGPNAVARDTLEDVLHDWAKVLDGTVKPPDPPFDGQEFFNKAKALAAILVEPMIAIDGVQGVEIRSLRVTLPGTPRATSGLSNAAAIKLTGAGLRMTDCAIVGCAGDGVRGEGGSSLEIEDCLIAGCWSSGVAMLNREPGRLSIVNSDIRNCYYNNIYTGWQLNPFIIEGCRISGSAWFGIRYGDREPVIERNAIFDNASSGIRVDGQGGTIRHNLFYKNGGGMAFRNQGQCRLEENLFLANQGAAVYVNGATIPTIRHNIIAESPLGVGFGSEVKSEISKSLIRLNVSENFLWKIDRSLARLDPPERGGGATDLVIELPQEAGNRIADPQVSIGQQQVVFEANSPVRDFDLTAIETVSLQSRWPLTLEEQAMIPSDGTREWNKWKMKPR